MGIFYFTLLLYFYIAILDSKFFVISDLALIFLFVLAFLRFSSDSADSADFANCAFYKNFYFAFCAFLLFALISIFTHGLGFGDVKLIFVIAFQFGFFTSLKIFLISTVLAILYCVFLKLKTEKIPYGSFLALTADFFFSCEVVR